MAKKAKSGSQSEHESDSDEYLTRWARELADSVTQEQLQEMLASYRRIARTSDDEQNRSNARKRAKFLARVC